MRTAWWTLCLIGGLAVSLSAQAGPGPARGTIHADSVTSPLAGGTRRVWVYLPAGYPTTCAPDCDLLVAFDGADYLEAMALPAILDSLIALNRLPPTVALLIDNGSSAVRLADLANHARFAQSVAEELVPWLRARWRVTADPARSTVTGSSAGGLGAAYLAFRHPDVFGRVVSQSGAFWRGNEGSNGPPWEWLTTAFATASRKPIRFVLEVGSTETRGAMRGAAPSILDANRRLRDALREKGYPVTYAEVPHGVHAPETWRGRLPAALVAAIGELRRTP